MSDAKIYLKKHINYKLLNTFTTTITLISPITAYSLFKLRGFDSLKWILLSFFISD